MRMIFLYSVIVATFVTATHLLVMNEIVNEPSQEVSGLFDLAIPLISASVFYYVVLSIIFSSVNVMLDVTDRVFSISMIIKVFDNLPSVMRSSLRYGALLCGTIGVVGDLTGFAVIAYVANLAVMTCWASSIFTLSMGCEKGRFSPMSL